jgi:hypothetical protein
VTDPSLEVIVSRDRSFAILGWTTLVVASAALRFILIASPLALEESVGWLLAGCMPAVLLLPQRSVHVARR